MIKLHYFAYREKCQWRINHLVPNDPFTKLSDPFAAHYLYYLYEDSHARSYSQINSLLYFRDVPVSFQESNTWRQWNLQMRVWPARRGRFYRCHYWSSRVLTTQASYMICYASIWLTSCSRAGYIDWLLWMDIQWTKDSRIFQMLLLLILKTRRPRITLVKYIQLSSTDIWIVWSLINDEMIEYDYGLVLCSTNTTQTEWWHWYDLSNYRTIVELWLWNWI